MILELFQAWHFTITLDFIHLQYKSLDVWGQLSQERAKEHDNVKNK